MKMKFWLVLYAMISTGVLADQQSTNSPHLLSNQAYDAATTNAPAAKPASKKAPAPKKTAAAAKKAAAKKPAPGSELKTVPLVPGPAVVSASHVNVRGRAGLVGEVITHMTNGEPVTVIEEIKLKHSMADEPSAWAKIQLPSSAHAWVKASYVDATNKTVIPKKLNLRGGPGENYSVLGTLQRGDTVTETESKGEWVEIEAPTNAYAFMAAQYLSQQTPGLPPPTTEPAPPPTVVAENPPVAPPSTNTTLLPPPTEAPMTNPPPVTPAVEEPPPPRIVQREGLVRGTISIQAPTSYELISVDTHKTINYLYTTSPDLDLSRYKGLHIIVTGEEGLDERWHNTPVITIHRIQVID
jgi:uncharacterized protein YgiM (DUF1202 family)